MNCSFAVSVSFDDVIKGKGRGLIVLSQYYSLFLVASSYTDIETSGPPGLGKILTAEAVAEHPMLPLYSVCVLSRLFPWPLLTPRSLPEN